MVNYQGDLYMGQDGARYEATNYPQQVDVFGVIKEEMEPLEEPYYGSKMQMAKASTQFNEQARPSHKPTGSGMTSNPYIEKIFKDFNINANEEASF